MKRLLRLLCALLIGVPWGPSFAADAESEIIETYRGSLSDYLGGRYPAAESGYQYLVTLGSADPTPTANIALMLRDQGKPHEAAAQWLKATLLDKENAFLW
ncbi:MAG: hypothetical protein JKY36_07905, partial [Erythrobacter sp.]|nr:hypothetical protein [Erythrobacter sp.]